MADQFPVVATPEALRMALCIPPVRKELYDELRCCCDPPSPEITIPKEAQESFDAAMVAWIHGDAHGFWLEPESGDGHCDPRQFVTAIATRLSELSHCYNSDLTGSPIEDRLLGGLLWLSQDWAGFPKLNEYDEPATYRPDGFRPGVSFWITPQAQFGKYRADFCLWFECGREKGGVVVECDGHQFHEKNKEQAARDKKRDREMLKAGFPVMRFTGSEIHNDTPGCVSQISEVLAEILYRVSKEGGMF